MIDRAAGCMPDGTVFSIPDRDLPPEPFQPGTLSSKEPQYLSGAACNQRRDQ